MLTALRARVNAVLADTPVNRRPALRRSDAPDALLATDLPLAADPAAVDGFISRITALGWRVTLADNGWLLLDADVPVPTAAECTGTGECACCISLLERHRDDGDAAVWIRSAVKAAEAGKLPFERYCAALHQHLASMLRRHEPLPGALLPYLRQAAFQLYNRREDR